MTILTRILAFVAATFVVAGTSVAAPASRPLPTVTAFDFTDADHFAFTLEASTTVTMVVDGQSTLYGVRSHRVLINGVPHQLHCYVDPVSRRMAFSLDTRPWALVSGGAPSDVALSMEVQRRLAELAVVNRPAMPPEFWLKAAEMVIHLSKLYDLIVGPGDEEESDPHPDVTIENEGGTVIVIIGDGNDGNGTSGPSGSSGPAGPNGASGGGGTSGGGSTDSGGDD